MGPDQRDEMPPRPPLSVPFPLQLGDDFYAGTLGPEERVPNRPEPSSADRFSTGAAKPGSID